MVFSENIYIEDEKIEAVKQWPESQSVQNIQIFLGFANFYKQFIKEFSQIATSLILRLKISSIKSAKPKKGRVGIGNGSRARCNGSKIDGSEVDSNEIEDYEVGKKVQKTTKSKNLSKSKKTVGSLNFFTFKAKLPFIKLRQVFFKARILYHFNLERYIWIKTDVLGYAIGGIFSQLILDNLC